MENRFQSFPFKCNLQRYNEDEKPDEEIEVPNNKVKLIIGAGVGLYSCRLQLSCSLQAPGFNP